MDVDRAVGAQRGPALPIMWRPGAHPHPPHTHSTVWCRSAYYFGMLAAPDQMIASSDPTAKYIFGDINGNAYAGGKVRAVEACEGGRGSRRPHGSATALTPPRPAPPARLGLRDQRVHHRQLQRPQHGTGERLVVRRPRPVPEARRSVQLDAHSGAGAFRNAAPSGGRCGTPTVPAPPPSLWRRRGTRTQHAPHAVPRFRATPSTNMPTNCLAP